MSQTVIIDGLRTPFGKLGGVFKDINAVDLTYPLIAELVKRHNLDQKAIDEVIIGQVVQAGSGQIPSRQALLKANLPNTTESTTINKVCASGLRSVTIGDLRIRANDANLILAGGMESMSQAPYLVEANVARFGKKMGHTTFKDAMLCDGLECPITGHHMAYYGAKVAEEFGITRQSQDEWAYRSHKLAVEAHTSGVFGEEILPVKVKQGKNKEAIIDCDEGPRSDTTIEALSKLKPVFYENGTITAGNAPGVNDGACMLIITSLEYAKEHGLKPLAKILTHASLGKDLPYLATAPALATQKALSKCGLTVKDIGAMEINEAFAAVALKSMSMLGINSDLVNPNGGAIALGHPVGASGARILLTLAKHMQRNNIKYGASAICSGTGQGDCVILSREGL